MGISWFSSQLFLNDYMKHIIETKLQINGQKNIPKISEILTYFHNLTQRLLFFKGQKSR